tara:strand:+ start:162 stop:329 length:168 start_codon:yes stop_codon:yes gene_type:complete
MDQVNQGQHREREAATPPGRMTIGMAAAGLKKGVTHGGGCQTANQLTRLASAEGK